MKTKITLIAILLAPTAPQAAIYCDSDAECLTKGISLIKRAAKAGCADAQSLGNALLKDSRLEHILVQEAELCIEASKAKARLEKGAIKRIARIKAAMDLGKESKK